MTVSRLHERTGFEWQFRFFSQEAADPISRTKEWLKAGTVGAVGALALLLVGCGSSGESTGTAFDTTASAESVDQLSFIEPVPVPEDIIALPDTKWVLTSTMMHGETVGGLAAIDSETTRFAPVWPSPDAVVAWDREAYAECPGPPDESSASTHGINLTNVRPGAADLLVVNHGGRESVEVFEIDTSGDVPVATWRGCRLLPEGTNGNGVVGLPGGGIAVTHMVDPAAPADQLAAIFGEDPSGDVRVWTSDKGWVELEGSDGHAPNGIETSPDGTTLYVAEWGARSVVSIPVGGGVATTIVEELPFLPDNLRSTPDGRLLLTGQALDDQAAVARCMEPGVTHEDCPTGFTIVEIDPTAKTFTEVFDTDTAEIDFTTVAAPVGEDIWVGTLRHDKIARVSGLSGAGGR